MARLINSRLIIKGQFRAEGPLHVGGMGSDADVDLALAVNGQGELYIPGTSLAGPLRAWVCAAAGKDVANELWGFQPETRNAAGGQASFVLIEDSCVHTPNATAVEVRDGVGIDRRTGTAADHAKYTRTVLPVGTTFDFMMTVEIATEAQAACNKALIAALLQALVNEEVRFGAAKTRGLGRMSLHHLKISEQQMTTAAGMLATLRALNGAAHDAAGVSLEEFAKDLSPLALQERPRLSIVIDWQPRGPVMVKAERDGLAVDMLPLTSRVDDKVVFVLPGSSVKGVLRSRAEMIARTVNSTGETPNKFLDQLKLPLICELFGAAGETEKKDKAGNGAEPAPQSEAEILPGLSALTVEDCFAQQRIEADKWRAVETATTAAGLTDEQALAKALGAAGLEHTQQAFHVAIDRWTGGAADSFLYTVLEPHGIDWQPLRLGLDMARIQSVNRRAAVACLLLVLRDLAQGRIPLGFGVNRGMGAVEITGLKITPSGLAGDVLDKLQALTICDGRLEGWSDTLKDTLNNAWRDWIARGEAA